MQVTFNTNNSYNYSNQYKNQKYPQQRLYSGISQQPSFTGGFNLPFSSKFLEPLEKAFDKFTTFLAKKYIKPLYESKVGKWLSRQDSVGQIVNHMQMIGSIIVSGFYMSMTLRNKSMDDETKKKLSINQGLTWIVATLGAYGLDAALDKAWDKNVSLKYATNFLYVPEKSKFKTKKEFYNNLVEGLEEYNKKLKAEFDADPKNKVRGIFGKKKFKPALATKYISQRFENSALTSDLKSLDVMKSLAVFGTIYRFVSPVAVTPVANWIGDQLFPSTVKSEPEQNNPFSNVPMLKTVKMANFVK